MLLYGYGVKCLSIRHQSLLRWMAKILHDLSSGSVSDALRAVSPHPDVNVGEASGSCRIFSTRACRPFGSSGLNIKIQGFAGEKPLSRNRCRIYRSNSTASPASVLLGSQPSHTLVRRSLQIRAFHLRWDGLGGCRGVGVGVGVGEICKPICKLHFKKTHNCALSGSRKRQCPLLALQSCACRESL